MSGNVTRIPVQHKEAPHCEVCEIPLPTFDGVMMTMCPIMPATLLSVTYKIQCICGAVWNLEKGIKVT